MTIEQFALCLVVVVALFALQKMCSACNSANVVLSSTISQLMCANMSMLLDAKIQNAKSRDEIEGMRVELNYDATANRRDDPASGPISTDDRSPSAGDRLTAWRVCQRTTACISTNGQSEAGRTGDYRSDAVQTSKRKGKISNKYVTVDTFRFPRKLYK